jgi:hypothetical protein
MLFLSSTSRLCTASHAPSTPTLCVCVPEKAEETEPHLLDSTRDSTRTSLPLLLRLKLFFFHISEIYIKKQKSLLLDVIPFEICVYLDVIFSMSARLLARMLACYCTQVSPKKLK